ncbi:hypothetical protein J0X19_18705 [Hymenobacter sp. BT186]|uniref:Uncharacterized protein n=1 Tax=Hymenobacter telluris TaxID=2816474 RepID=A0A939JEI8_9BACT|nr:hypothetical protein [Hymenobacter telluris]MBO0359998.1 hypothetical protein [Hymenobacter telluris]MBW3376025.1 hypothetical protein [Hymenobacter norwichensis]
MGGALLVFFLIGLLVLSVPIGIGWNIYEWLRKRGNFIASQVFLGTASAILLTLGYFVYTAFYPNDEFYETEFKQITSSSFPETGVLLVKDASYPDQHGDYSVCALVEVSPQEYQRTLQQVANEPTFTAVDVANNAPFARSESFNAVAGNIPAASYSRSYSRGSTVHHAFQFVGFLTDRKTIVIYRHSS